ncbi:transposase [Acetobacterium sp.]|uniref:transposase n=1 Tax=Acetobacterium sp. TaxID=1872094 RepID=UPI002F41507B
MNYSHRTWVSGWYSKQRLKVAKLHETIVNQRKDFLHKLSRQITNANDVVCIEDLDMKAMSKETDTLKLGKATADKQWKIIEEDWRNRENFGSYNDDILSFI